MFLVGWVEVIKMANYNQYDGSASNTTMAQRLLDNGSDWLTVRVGQYDTLFVQGVLDKENNKITYSGKSWIYNSRDSSLTYKGEDSGSVALINDSYVYSSLEGYQSLAVNDVFPRYTFILLFVVLLVVIGFNVIKKRWIL